MRDTASLSVGCTGVAFREAHSAEPDCSCLLDVDGFVKMNGLS